MQRFTSKTSRDQVIALIQKISFKLEVHQKWIQFYKNTLFPSLNNRDFDREFRFKFRFKDSNPKFTPVFTHKVSSLWKAPGKIPKRKIYGDLTRMKSYYVEHIYDRYKCTVNNQNIKVWGLEEVFPSAILIQDNLKDTFNWSQKTRQRIQKQEKSLEIQLYRLSQKILACKLQENNVQSLEDYCADLGWKNYSIIKKFGQETLLTRIKNCYLRKIKPLPVKKLPVQKEYIGYRLIRD